MAASLHSDTPYFRQLSHISTDYPIHHFRGRERVLLRKGQPPYFNALTTSYEAVHVCQLAVDLNVGTSTRCHL